MKAETLALDIWTRKNRPMGQIWLSRKQGAWMLSLMDAEGAGQVYGTQFMEITVPGMEDREADLRVYEAFSGAVSIEIRVHKTAEEEAAAVDARIAAADARRASGEDDYWF